MTQIPATKKNENIFSLRRLKKDCYFPPISVDFTPIRRPNNTFQTIFPVFNTDANYYTPAFINPYQQSLIKSNAESSHNHEKEKFFKKVQAYVSKPEEDSPFFNPKDDLYCSICAISFDDYWKHICSSYHQRKVKASTGNRYITEICEPFKKEMSQKMVSKNTRECLKPKKEKKIQKRGRERKCRKEVKTERNEDLIIKIPKDLFDGEDRGFNFNLSTNGVTSLNQKL